MIFGRVRRGVGLMEAAASALRAGMLNNPAVLIDVGARGGLSRSWHYLWRAGFVAPAFFEPDPTAAAEIRARSPSAVIIQQGLWSANVTKTLHITMEPGCSSILVPMPDTRIPDTLKRMLTTERELTVNLVTAESALSSMGISPEILKIDIQGAELEALKGFGKLLRSVICIEMEVSFMRAYRDQPLFGNLYDFMFDAGFGLFDLKLFGVAGTRNGIQANAFFCRRELTSDRQKAIEKLFMGASDFSYRR